jgi:hypothetical protein
MSSIPDLIYRLACQEIASGPIPTPAWLPFVSGAATPSRPIASRPETSDDARLPVSSEPPPDVNLPSTRVPARQDWPSLSHPQIAGTSVDSNPTSVQLVPSANLNPHAGVRPKPPLSISSLITSHIIAETGMASSMRAIDRHRLPGIASFRPGLRSSNSNSHDTHTLPTPSLRVSTAPDSSDSEVPAFHGTPTGPPGASADTHLADAITNQTRQVENLSRDLDSSLTMLFTTQLEALDQLRQRLDDHERLWLEQQALRRAGFAQQSNS